MSLYQLQRAIFDFLNARGDLPPVLDRAALAARYGLTEAELAALVEPDVRALIHLGVHPVLLNSYARARVPRDRYRAVLADLSTGAGASPR